MIGLTAKQKKLGYYTVGNQEFFSKIDACIAGTKQNVHPTWHFNDGVWNAMQWHAEPEVNILDLYRARARQLREKYDYILIYYSGGSDSQTVVESFIDAGCHIDEIVTVWNRAHDKNFVASTAITDARNIEAEFEFTTRPGLEWIRNVSPKTKITYQDVSDDILEYLNHYDGEEWLGQVTEHLNPQNLGRFSSPKTKHQKLLLDQGKQTALIYGADKPKVCIKDGKYHVYFVDVVANNFKGVGMNHDYYNMTPEFFYWTPDMPEIVVKQAHMIRKWFDLNPALKSILSWPNFSWTHRNTYETITRSIIYPHWNFSRFQVDKPRFTVYCEWDDWFFKHFSDGWVYQNWMKGIDHVKSNVDQKYLSYTFDQTFNGFVGMINGFFALD